MQQKSPQAVIVAIVLLLLPLMYVASYLVLVSPNARLPAMLTISLTDPPVDPWEHYRLPGKVWERVYWPLERIDRTVRPDFWSDDSWADDGSWDKPEIISMHLPVEPVRSPARNATFPFAWLTEKSDR